MILNRGQAYGTMFQDILKRFLHTIEKCPS